MKKITVFYGLLLILFRINTISAQNLEWINYTCGKSVSSVGIEGNMVWVGTESGLVQLDLNSENMTYYNKANSGLPYNPVTSIAIDGSGNKWIGTGVRLRVGAHGALAKFDGTNWTVYNTSNSGLSDNYILSISIDENGNKWIVTEYDGLFVYREEGIVAVDENPAQASVPQCFKLESNYPNPFNTATIISFTLDKPSFVCLTNYDLLGRKVCTLLNELVCRGDPEPELDSGVLAPVPSDT
jgi:ligand-binding sensor domain-containing protein